MERFKIRPYTKKELALLYFPDSEPHAAVNHLMAWIKNAKDLIARLEEAGYQKTAKMLTPRQVELIVDDFGEP